MQVTVLQQKVGDLGACSALHCLNLTVDDFPRNTISWLAELERTCACVLW